MEAARQAIGKITSRTGHKTDVDEIVNPAVTSETIKPHRHEETTEAIDREVHQDHYHTTVQPIQHREVIPEKHTHNLAPQIQKEFRHDNEDETRRTVSAELGRFQNTSTTERTTTSHQAAPTVTGEHVHHHVHETVQPVIHKETVQPEVVHTTIPIHEVHHASATHHGMSALPVKTLDEFTRAGGLISGTKSHTHEEYEGAPRPYNEKLSTTLEKVLPGHHGSSTTGTHGTHGTTGTTGLTGNTHSSHTGGLNTTTNTTTSTTHGTHGLGSSNTGYDNSRSGGLTNNGSGIPGTTGYNNTNAGGIGSGNNYGNESSRTGGLTGSSHTGRDTKLGTTDEYDSRRPDSGVGGVEHKKPSLMDKLNPKVDANGDGKAGFMK